MFGKQSKGHRRQSFLHGALILTAGVLLVKVIGALFKIPLSAIITEDGMGYFSTAYSFYNVIFSIATAGFPVAVSRMVSESDSLGHWNDVRRVKSAAFPIFLVLGAVGTSLMILTAPFYTRAVGNPGALPALLVLAPSVFLCSVSSVYRGYYEGLCNMYPTTVSQVVESLVKLVFGLSGAYFVMHICTEELNTHGTVLAHPVESVSAGQLLICGLSAAAAILGVTLGSLCSLLYLHRADRRADTITAAMYRASPAPASHRAVTKRLVRTAIPIAVGAVAMSFSGLIDASFLQTRVMAVLRENPEPMLNMYAGCIPAENLNAPSSIPNFLFGCYNMALTLFMLVPSVTQAFGVSALPSVTHAWTRGVHKALSAAVETVLRITCMFALPAGIGLSVLAEPVTELIYGARMSTPIIARALTVMGIGAIFAAVTTPLGSMLQAVGRMELPVILVLGGLGVKIILNYILAGIPEINILGGGISTLVCYFLVTLAEGIALLRITHVRIHFGNAVLKPLFASLLCAATALGVQHGMGILTGGSRLDTVASVLSAVLVYGVSLVLLRALQASDFAMLPSGEKIAKRLQKYLKNTEG